MSPVGTQVQHFPCSAQEGQAHAGKSSVLGIPAEASPRPEPETAGTEARGARTLPPGHSADSGPVVPAALLPRSAYAAVARGQQRLRRK